MDIHVRKCSRKCAKTGEELKTGEPFYSVLMAEGADLVRYDYSVAAWTGPPDGAMGWWKSRIPSRDAKRLHWAPNDVMLELFTELEEQLDKQDMRYILTLLLIRRRVLRLEQSERDAEGNEQLVVFCPRRDATYRVTSRQPDNRRTQEIQDELAALLLADAA